MLVPLTFWIDKLFSNDNFRILSFIFVYCVANFQFIEEFKLIWNILFTYFTYFFCEILY